MSIYDYRQSLEIAGNDRPFYAMIMAAMRQGDTNNVSMLKQCWPDVWEELQARYWAPGGLLPGEGED